MRTALIVAALAGGVCSSADAYWWNGAYGQGIGGLYRSLDYPTENRVPYFASRPPVYYSVPVPRTYGYSPFAYPPTVRTPDVASATCSPVEVINPYVPSSGKAAPSAPSKRRPKARTVGKPATSEPVGPLVIENPFVSDPIGPTT